MQVNKTSQTESELPVLSSHVVAQRRNYYSKTFILFNILEHSKGREMAFLYNLNRKDNVRYLNAGSLPILMEYLGLQNNEEKANGIESKNPFKFFTNNKKNLNIYCSLATVNWQNCPVKAFNYAVFDRMNQQKEFRHLIKTNLKKYITDFTGAIDFDGNQDYVIEDGKEVKVEVDCSAEESVIRSLEDLKVVISIFEDYKIKWRVHFSGNRGFHLFWDCDFDGSAYQKREVVNDMVRLFYEVFELKTVDRANYNTMKVMKTSYSLTTTNGISRVVLPLSEYQIENFKLSEMECNWVYYNVEGLKNRGLLWHNTNIPESERKKNFKRFMDDYELTIPEHREEEDE